LSITEPHPAGVTTLHVTMISCDLIQPVLFSQQPFMWPWFHVMISHRKWFT